MRPFFVHAAASAVASALLFAVQPWAAKVLLPSFGGSAAVWLTSLLFFQTAVVAGYLYAHVAARLPRWVHIGLLVAGALVPVAVAPHDLGLPAVGEVLAALAVGLGVLTVLVSSTTPLLHSWLARDAEDEEPYLLYAASNVGSLAGLLAYPLVIEPFIPLPTQSLLWRTLFGAVVLFVAFTAWTTRNRTYRPEPPAEVGEASPRAPWFLNAFVPASLLYGFTGFVTRDIAAVPLLWVVPLAVYLLTFVAAFARKPLRLPEGFAWAGPALLYATAIATVVWPASLATLALHFIAFSLFALYFHGKLSEHRPGSGEATAYYLWVSLGGVAAGLFNAVLAPLMFDGPGEYPLTYGLALVLIPASYVSTFSPAARRALHGAMMIALAIGFIFAPGELGPKLGAGLMMALAFVVALGMPALSHVMLAVFLGAVVTFPGDAEIIEQRRSFYGSHAVEGRTIDDEQYVGLAVGITLHGHERIDGPVAPLGYYHRRGPGGRVLEDVASTHAPMRVALVGLGVGAMALYSRPGDTFTFFELDPSVVELAETHFRALKQAEGDVKIEVVDGRLGLQQSAERFDLIVVDAFSSDAIPTHLLTVEAFRMYGDRLAPGGRVLMHTSNRYLDIDRIVVAGFESLGWAHRQQHWDPGKSMPPGAWPSSWVVAAPDVASLGAMREDPAWQKLRSDLVWTDAYSSIFRALR